MNQKDCVAGIEGPDLNITTFGVCSCPTNYTGGSVTLVSEAPRHPDGSFTGAPATGTVVGMPCVPIIIDEWDSPHSETKIGASKSSSLTTESFLVCAHGGLIRVWRSGQEEVETTIEDGEVPLGSAPTDKDKNLAEVANIAAKYGFGKPVESPKGSGLYRMTTSFDEQNRVYNDMITVNKSTGAITIERGGEITDKLTYEQNNKLEAALGEKLVTKRQLVEYGWSDVSNIEVLELNRVLKKYEITSDLQVSFFMGQVKHESGTFTRTLEKFDLNPNKGIYTPEDFFNQKYGKQGNNLGNVDENDGELFRGSGYIQLTGRGNYQAFSDYIDDPLIMTEGYKQIGGDYNRPIGEIESTDRGVIDIGKYAWESAGWFWAYGNTQGVHLNIFADEKDATEVKNGINRKETDAAKLKHRQDCIKEFYEILTGDDSLKLH